MKTVQSIPQLISTFFHNYLASQRGFSANTILAYRDCLKLFLCFSATRIGKSVDKLIMEDFDHELVGAFLDHLERTRGNSIQTRNARLAALHAFFRYVGGQEPTALARCQQICTVPSKRTTHKMIEYLEDKEMRALLKSVEQNSSSGVRDYALLLFLYNTGARVQEAVNLKIEDLRLDTPAQVKLLGKGRKERVCPLWEETVQAIGNYLKARVLVTSQEPSIFLNANGQPITRYGIRYIVRRHAAKAAAGCSSLRKKRVSPHTIRHTTAMHLLQSGNEINVVRDWLGHASVETTHAYAQIDMKMKREALQAGHPFGDGKTLTKKHPKWLNPSILKWLDELSKRTNIMWSATNRSAPLSV